MGSVYTDLNINILEVLPPFLAAFFTFVIAYSYGAGSGYRTLFMYVGMGLLCWALADFIWLWYAVLELDPFPSVADFFYVAAYPFLFLAALKVFYIHKIEIDFLYNSIAMSVFLIFSTIISYLGVSAVYEYGAPLLDNMLSVSYIIGDIALFLPMLLLLSATRSWARGAFYRLALWYGVALVLVTIADVAFALAYDRYETEVPVYYSLNMLWLLAYWVFMYVPFQIAKIQMTVQKKISQNDK